MNQDFKVYLRLISYLKPYWGVALLVLIGFGMNSATEVSVAKLIKFIIDAIQNAKNQFVDTFVWDEKIKTQLKTFVEAQRVFTKQVSRSALEVFDYTLVSAKTSFEKVKAFA